MNKIEKINETVRTLLAGGVVLIATDTVYGLAAMPFEDQAVEKIYALKKRPRELFLPIMVAAMQDLEVLGVDINPNARKLFEYGLVPGAVTFVLGFRGESLKPCWLKKREEIAARIPANDLLLAVLKETGPLLVTSANLHGQPVTQANVKDILAELNGVPDLIMDDGEGKEAPSTIINCRFDPPVIERKGIIPVDEINHILTTRT